MVLDLKGKKIKEGKGKLEVNCIKKGNSAFKMPEKQMSLKGKGGGVEMVQMQNIYP